MSEYDKSCTRWKKCSVNCCPLDVKNQTRYTISGDPERTCKEHIGRRLEVVSRAVKEGVSIPGGGITPSEAKRLSEGETIENLCFEWDYKENKAKERGFALASASRMVQGPINHRAGVHTSTLEGSRGQTEADTTATDP